jgi:hypothetical protein
MLKSHFTQPPCCEPIPVFDFWTFNLAVTLKASRPPTASRIPCSRNASAEVFITCDAAQAELARVAGLTQIQLFK